jgi:hypothetical protein
MTITDKLVLRASCQQPLFTVLKITSAALVTVVNIISFPQNSFP